MTAHTAEEIQKEKKVYLMVLGGLAVLTLATVAVAYIDLTPAWAVIVALFIASIKGFLVAGFFMHLLSEKRLIYGILVLTVVFFAVLLWGPWHHWYNALGGTP